MDSESPLQPDVEQNRRAWDGLVRVRQGFTRAAEDQDFVNPLKTVDGLGWLGDCIRGQRLLCLAAGGGRQSALYAAAGANVVVVDISPAMLALDRQVAMERNLDLQTVQASMDDLRVFSADQFDIVVQPVSTCYVACVSKVYHEIARVMRSDGLYISQHKQPSSLQAAVEPSRNGLELVEPYYRDGPLPVVHGSRHREEGTLEYLHRWEELLGGMCRAGFVIEDVVEPFHATPGAARGTFAHRCAFVPPYVRVKARRRKRDGRSVFVSHALT